MKKRSRYGSGGSAGLVGITRAAVYPMRAAVYPIMRAAEYSMRAA